MPTKIRTRKITPRRRRTLSISGVRGRAGAGRGRKVGAASRRESLRRARPGRTGRAGRRRPGRRGRSRSDGIPVAGTWSGRRVRRSAAGWSTRGELTATRPASAARASRSRRTRSGDQLEAACRPRSGERLAAAAAAPKIMQPDEDVPRQLLRPGERHPEDVAPEHLSRTMTTTSRREDARDRLDEVAEPLHGRPRPGPGGGEVTSVGDQDLRASRSRPGSPSAPDP